MLDIRDWVQTRPGRIVVHLGPGWELQEIILGDPDWVRPPPSNAQESQDQVRVGNYQLVWDVLDCIESETACCFQDPAQKLPNLFSEFQDTAWKLWDPTGDAVHTGVTSLPTRLLRSSNKRI